MNLSDKVKLIDQGIKLDLEDLTVWKKSNLIDRKFVRLNIELATNSMKQLIQIRKTLTSDGK